MPHRRPAPATKPHKAPVTCLLATSTEHHLEQPPLSTTAATNFSTIAIPPGPTTVTATTSQPAFTHQASSLPAAVTFNIQVPLPMTHGAPQQLPQVIRIQYSRRYLLYCPQLCLPLTGPCSNHLTTN